MTLKGTPSRGGAVRAIVPFRFVTDRDAVCMFYCYPHDSKYIIITDSHKMMATLPGRHQVPACRFFALFKSRTAKKRQRKHIDTVLHISRLIWEMPGTPVVI